MGKTILALEDWSNDLQTLACATEDTAFPVANLQSLQVRGGDRFRTTNADEMVITMERAKAAAFNSVFALYGIAGERASWRMRARIGGPAGAIAHDTANGFGAGVRFGLDNLVNDAFAVGSWGALRSITLSCRIRPDMIRRQGILDLSGVTGKNARVTMRADGAIRFYGVSPSDPLRGNLVSTTLAKVGEWMRIDASYDDPTGTLSLYIDGALEASVSGVSNMVSGIINLFVSWVEGETFAGTIDDVRLWGDVRTPGEILADANVELDGTEPDLTSYWKLNGDYTNEIVTGPILIARGTPLPIFTYPERFWWSPDIGFEKYRHAGFFFAPGITADFVEVSVHDPENTVAHQSLGRLQVSAAWETLRGRLYGAQIGRRGRSQKTLLEGSTPTRRHGSRGAHRFSIVTTEKAEAMVADRLGRQAGDGRAVVIAHDADDEEWRHQQLLYGQLGAVQDVTATHLGRWEYAVEAVEI